MLSDYNLNPFMHLPNCQLHEQGEKNITCEDTHNKIIALRAYFVLAILNFLFIIFTTAYFSYRFLSSNWKMQSFELLPTTNQNISKQWRMYSLKKRNIFGSVLGALGHLIFTTSVLLYQVFINNFSCDIFLWGPMVGFFIWTYALLWRSYRLHLLIRFSELQQSFHKRNATSYNNCGEKKNVKSTTSIHRNDRDFKWFTQRKDTLHLSTRYHVAIFSFFLFIIICIVTLAESLSIWANGSSSCEIYMGNFMVSAFVGFFFLVIVPFIFWFLRDDEDAHGVRKEIWITVAVGIPCCIMCIIWQIVFEYPTSKNPAGVRGVFGPCNWLLILTTTNHIVSIISPVFKTLSIDSKNKKSRTSQLNKKCKRSLSIFERFPLTQHIKCKYERKKRRQSTKTLGHSTATSGYHWELTVESLYKALNEPEQLAILKEWAIKDFSVENILFYERYLSLVNQLKDSITAIDGRNNHTSICSQDSLFKPSQELLNMSFSSDQIPQLIDIYNTFIIDQAPLQINISYKARNCIDKIMRPLSKQHQNNLAVPGPSSVSVTPLFMQHKRPYDTFKHMSNKNASCEVLTTSTIANTNLVIMQEKLESGSFDDNRHITRYSETIEHSSPTLDIFEQARKEVFWNIFSGLFPKVIEAYNIHSYE